MGDGKAGGRGPGRANTGEPRAPSPRRRRSSFAAGGALSLTVHLGALAVLATHGQAPLHLINARTTSGPDLTAVAFEVYSADVETGVDLPAPETAVTPAAVATAAQPAAVSRPRARRPRLPKARMPISVESEARPHGLALAPGTVPDQASGAETVGELDALSPEPLAAEAGGGRD